MRLRRSCFRVVTPPLIASLLAVHLDGCAGTGVNTRSISEPYRTDAVSLSSARQVPPGTTVELTRRDGTVLRGRYLGVDRMTEDEYARSWSAVTVGAKVSLPAPGTRVTLRTYGGPSRTGIFEGFGIYTFSLRDSSGASETIPFLDVREVDDGERTWATRDLAREGLSGHLPAYTLVRLGVSAGEVRIPADQIAEARVEDAAGKVVETGVLIAVVAVAAGIVGGALVVGSIFGSIDHACGA